MIMDELAEYEEPYNTIGSSKKRTNFELIKNMNAEEMARMLFSLPHDEISKVKTSNGPGIDLLDVVEWLNSESEE